MRVAVAALLALATAVAVVHSPVRGQTTVTDTPTPTPTATAAPTPTPTGPSATDLFTQADAAVTAKGTAHFTGSSTSTDGQTERRIDTVHGDESFKSVRSHAIDVEKRTDLTRTPSVTKKTTTETIAVGSRVATRTARKAWKCTKVDTSNATSLSGALNSIAGSVKVSTTFGEPATDTIHGTPVWHLRTTVDLSGLTGTSMPLVLDTYVSQKNKLILRETGSVTLDASLGASGTVHAVSTIKEDFTKYGEKLKISLPKACAHTAADRMSLLHVPLELRQIHSVVLQLLASAQHRSR